MNSPLTETERLRQLSDLAKQAQRFESFIRRIPPEVREEMDRRALAHFVQLDGKDGNCVENNCGGAIVRQYLGGMSGGTPYCERCHRPYPFAGDVPFVGIEEYDKSFNYVYGL